ISHGVTESDIATLAESASLVPGATDLIGQLQRRGTPVRCITTTYRQYAQPLCGRLGIIPENVAATVFPLPELAARFAHALASLPQIQEDVLRIKHSGNAGALKSHLDSFYWNSGDIAALVGQVKPVGGERKVAAVKAFATALRTPLADWAVIGDSITDFKMLDAVNAAGGLAIAFNANEYALPYATMGLASTSIAGLAAVLQTWQDNGIAAVEELVREKERAGGSDSHGYFHWLRGRETSQLPLDVHKRIRRLVREEAAILG
ncbi:MAG: hypothetical protein V1737_04835, partial [Chloroflexota bacterium]